jgi:hypothetical protein
MHCARAIADQPAMFVAARTSTVRPDNLGGMLKKFLISHQRDLVEDCKEKVAARFAPADPPNIVDQGVPIFLKQLIEALTTRPSASSDDGDLEKRIPFPKEIGQSAALCGTELFRRGFTVDQVVHGYGDICQAITELAVELEDNIDSDDFRILNGCLDNAIAGAVTAYAEGQETAIDDLVGERKERLSDLRENRRQLVHIAVQAFTAMRTGGLGLTGATGGLLMHALTELQSLSDQPLAEAEAAARWVSEQDRAQQNGA